MFRGIMAKNMEATIQGLGFLALGRQKCSGSVL